MSPEPELTSELYRKLIAIKPEGMSANAWLVAAGVNRSFFTDLKKRGRARSDSIEKLLETAGLTADEFYRRAAPATVERETEHPRGNKLPLRRQDETRDIPLLGTAQGGAFEVGDDGTPVLVELIDLDLHYVVDTVRRPSTLVGRSDVYALTVIGDSMSPRYDAGDPAYVDPRQQPAIGDYVIVQLMKRDGEGNGHIVSVLIKRLVRRTVNYVELEQFNPSLIFRVPTSCIARIHRVIPWKEIIFF